jgi:hypothetical protein
MLCCPEMIRKLPFAEIAMPDNPSNREFTARDIVPILALIAFVVVNLFGKFQFVPKLGRHPTETHFGSGGSVMHNAVGSKSYIF